MIIIMMLAAMVAVVRFQLLAPRCGTACHQR